MKRLLMIVGLLVTLATGIALGVVFQQARDREKVEVSAQSSAERRLEALKKERPDEFKGESGEANAERYLDEFKKEERFQELLVLEADKKGIRVSRSDVRDRLELVMGSFADTKQFLRSLKDQGTTLTEYKQTLEEQLLQQKLMEKVTSGIKVTSSEVREYYLRNRVRFADPTDPTTQTPFANVSDLIEKELLREKKAARFQRYIEGLWERPS